MTITISTPTNVTPIGSATAPVAARVDSEKPRESFTISCDDCVLRRTAACDDCIVTFICGREADDAVVVDVSEIRAWRLLSDEGLVPELRHRRLGRGALLDVVPGAVGADGRTSQYESAARVVSR